MIAVMRFTRQIIVLNMVACLLLMPVLASPAAVLHQAQHTHHQAATHFSALCSWLCGVGQGCDLEGPLFVPTLSLLREPSIASIIKIDPAFVVLCFPRGPPSPVHLI
jgi:hypothetical protein